MSYPLDPRAPRCARRPRCHRSDAAARPGSRRLSLRQRGVRIRRLVTMAAVLDWELCTTGDPIADFSWSLQYWADPDDEHLSLAPGSPDNGGSRLPTARRRAVRRYVAQPRASTCPNYPFYKAFSWWKQACIVEGACMPADSPGARSAGWSTLGCRPPSIAERADGMFEHARRSRARSSDERGPLIGMTDSVPDIVSCRQRSTSTSSSRLATSPFVGETVLGGDLRRINGRQGRQPSRRGGAARPEE